MSKLRETIKVRDDADLAPPAEGDLKPYVIFTQLKDDGPFIYAGWLDAPDDQMALTFAREHYGQDQKCTRIWAAPRQFVGGLRENVDAAREEVDEPRQYQLFTQKEAGEQHVSAITVTARSAAAAIGLGRERIERGAEMQNIWAIPQSQLLSTDEDDLIWRYTDQTYRLARGYSRDVRDKWKTIRAEQDLEEYEKDDLQESF